MLLAQPILQVLRSACWLAQSELSSVSLLRVSPWNFGLGALRSSSSPSPSIPFREEAVDWHEPAMEEVSKERNSCKRPRATLAAGGGGGSAAVAAAWRTCRVARAAAGGKDRHSKVVTSRGLRDRRIRLSVPTAIQFYDIQDRLGVDQPSKAIEWLIRAAAAAIDALPSLDCSFTLPAASPPADDATEVSTSETSKGSVLSLANGPTDNGNAAAAAHQANAYNGGAIGAFAELLHCCAADDKPMQQQQPTLAYYAAAHAQSSHVAPMSFEMMPQLGFSQEQQQQHHHHHPAVAFDRSTLQSNAVAAAPLWPPSQHPFLMQRFSVAPGEASSILPFFIGGGSGAAAPVTANAAERRLQLWDFKEERKT